MCKAGPPFFFPFFLLFPTCDAHSDFLPSISAAQGCQAAPHVFHPWVPFGAEAPVHSGCRKAAEHAKTLGASLFLRERRNIPSSMIHPTVVVFLFLFRVRSVNVSISPGFVKGARRCQEQKQKAGRQRHVRC